MNVETLAQAISMQDTAMLTRVPGIGKKTAERIILELKENLDAAIDASLEEKLEEFAEDKNETDSDMQDAIYALRGLGFTQSEALQAVKKARPNAKDLQELIALALRSLN